MTIPAPPDRVLQARAAALLNGELMASRLGVTSCRPRYARYKPGTSLLVQYESEIDSAPALIHAWLFADARAARRWHSASFGRLLERARRRHRRLPLHAAYLTDLNVLLEVSPVDSRLPTLVRATSRRKVARLLATPVTRVETIRHKPGRKALLRLHAPAEPLYMKVYADGRSSDRFALARAVAASGVSTAPAVAHIDELGAVVFGEAPGSRLADLAPDAYRRWLRPAVEVLHAFHARAQFDGRSASERSRLETAGRAVDALRPELRGAGARLAAQIDKRLAAYAGSVTLTHGDFYDDQLLVGGAGIVLLDFDEARPGHPLVDVGNFLAHLSLGAGESLRAAFLDACVDGGFDLTGVLAFEAAALLALAVRSFRHLDAAWPARVEEAVELAATRLAADRAGPRLADSRLPQLHSLVDPIAARPVLARALGRSVAIADVQLLRHKPGRRCTLRYRLDDGGCVFAKTYASRRAARVHDSYRRLAGDNHIATPLPLGWDENARLVATAPLSGAPVLERVQAGDAQLGSEIADLLHALHSSDVVLDRRHTLHDELAPLAERVARLATLRPDAERCVTLAAAGLQRDWRWRRRPVHRDFYEDQLLADGRRLALLDVDDAAMSEPAVDVANLIAHLDLRALVSGETGPRLVARAFVRRYRALDGELDRSLVLFLVGTTWLRLAEIHLARRGEAIAARLLGRSERALRFALAATPRRPAVARRERQ